MKKIAIENNPNLYSLMEELKSYGYEVVTSDHIDAPVDAYIYYSKDNVEALSTINQQLNNVFSSIQSNSNEQHDYKTLLINAKNKTVDQIHYILTTRTYSPLF